MVAGELVAAVPDYEAKLYVASQAMDEARHVEVFGRYIRKLDKIYPAQPTLKGILKDIMETPHWQAKTVGMQVIPRVSPWVRSSTCAPSPAAICSARCSAT